MSGDEEPTGARHPRAGALRITIWLLAAMFCLFATLLGVAAGSAAGLIALGLFSLSMALGLLALDRSGALPYQGRTSSLQRMAWITMASVMLGVVGVIVRLGLPASNASGAVFIVALVLAVLGAIGAVAVVTRSPGAERPR